MKRIAASVVLSVLASSALAAPKPAMPPPLPPLREQDRIRQEWLKARLDRVLPALMRKHGVAMWLVVCREYNEDPVFFSLVSPSVMAARRRTILVFNDRGPEKGVERLALGGGSNGGLYEVYRDPDAENRELYGQGQWVTLRKLVDDRKPRNIAINVSQTHAFSDGLSVGEWEQLSAALGPWTSRVVRAEGLGHDYVSTRIPEMLPTYRHMQQIVHALIARAFSSEVITPGKTTSEDVVWWLRQTVNDLGYGEWFPPSVSVQRPGKGAASVIAGRDAVVIERGDHLHTDFGIKAMGLATDTQHVGYVLKAGETDAPAGLRLALANSNKLQDIVRERMKPGRTGNEVLADSLGRDEGGGPDGHRLHAPDRRPRPRRGPADRPVGPPAGRARPRRRADPAVDLVLDRAGGAHGRARVGRPGGAVGAGGGRRGRGGRHGRVGARAADEVPPGA